MIDTILYKRLSSVERLVSAVVAAPTLPIYDPANPPQDAVDAQIFIGTDDSINWFDESTATWNTCASSDVVVGNIPQDVLEGQIVIGSDDSLCWYSNGLWHGVAPTLATVGNTPQDPLEGQIVIGMDSLCWYSSGSWYGVSS